MNRLVRILKLIRNEFRKPSFDRALPKKGLSAINNSVLDKWFTADTDPDRQLLHTINTNKYSEHSPNYTEVSNMLFGTDSVYSKYEGINISQPMNYPPHFGEKTLNTLSEMLGRNPKLGLEVGSFIGSSAIRLGNIMKKNEGVLLCVDTWCGDINMWMMDKFSKTMDKGDGNPKIFFHFINNMIKNDLQDTVIPLRVSSTVAARMLKMLKWKIDFVYLDSAHECGETFLELSLYWNLLSNGGVLMGDDYEGFPAVKHDLDVFSEVIGQKPLFTGERDTWLLQKR